MRLKNIARACDRLVIRLMNAVVLLRIILKQLRQERAPHGPIVTRAFSYEDYSTRKNPLKNGHKTIKHMVTRRFASSLLS